MHFEFIIIKIIIKSSIIARQRKKQCKKNNDTNTWNLLFEVVAKLILQDNLVAQH